MKLYAMIREISLIISGIKLLSQFKIYLGRLDYQPLFGEERRLDSRKRQTSSLMSWTHADLLR